MPHIPDKHEIYQAAEDEQGKKPLREYEQPEVLGDNLDFNILVPCQFVQPVGKEVGVEFNGKGIRCIGIIIRQACPEFAVNPRVTYFKALDLVILQILFEFSPAYLCAGDRPAEQHYRRKDKYRY